MEKRANEDRVQITSRMSPDLYREVRKLAIDEGCFAADVMEQALREYLDRAKKK